MPYDRRQPVVARTTSFGLYQPLFTTNRRAAGMDSTPPTGREKFDPLHMGIYLRFLNRDGDSKTINTRLWNLSVQTGESVGDCRKCGHPMQAQPTQVVGHIHWYTARCANFEQCGVEVAAPNAKVLVNSSRRSEQPASARL